MTYTLDSIPNANDTAQWLRGRSNVTRKVTRNKGKTSTTITGHGEMSTLIGALETHDDAGRVPMSVLDDSLDRIRVTAHGRDGDALARWADQWAHAMGEELPALIGTERYAWSEAGTMPFDPQTMHSLAATSCGLSAGASPIVDAIAGTFRTTNHKRKTWPARLRVHTAPMRPRKGEHVRTVVRGDTRGVDPITGATSSSDWWALTLCPSLTPDGRVMVGHDRARARTITTRQHRALNARTAQGAYKLTGDVIDAMSHALNDALTSRGDNAGRWEWAHGDTRGAITASRAGRIGITGAGIRVVGARTATGAIAALRAQLGALIAD